LSDIVCRFQMPRYRAETTSDKLVAATKDHKYCVAIEPRGNASR
jgi:hypothetical protein